MEALTARMAAASVTPTLAPRSTTTTSAIAASAAPSPHTSPAAAGVTPHSQHPPPQEDDSQQQHQLPPTPTSFHSAAATNLLRSNPTYSSFHDYIWTPAHRPSRAHRAFQPPPSDAADDLQLPTLDMAALRCDSAGRRAAALAELGRVTRAWGFFQLANHGVAQSVVDGAEAHARALFALPPERKLAALRRGDSTDGYSCGAVGANVLGDQSGGARLENISWQETVHFSQYPAEVVPRLAEVLFGPDGGNPDFSRAMTEYLAALEQLGRDLVELLTESLGVPPRTLTYTTNTDDDGSSSSRVQLRNGLRINMYPPYPRPELTLGLVSHADPCLVTILHQDAVGGLQVLQQQQQRPGDGEPDRWVGVRPQRGCFVVNVGDMFQVYSNDLFPSALHRALVNATHDRLSMAVFVRPPMDARVAPFPELLLGKGESAYREFTYAEYRSAALKNKTEGRSNLDRFRVAPPPPPPRERGGAAAAATAPPPPPLGVGS